MLKHRLSSDDLENDYTLIAIHSNTEPYKLAFEINKTKADIFKLTFSQLLLKLAVNKE